MRQLKITKSITNRESASLDKYLQEIGKEELISVEEEVELAQRIRKGDQEALEKLTKAKYNPCCMTPLYDAIGKSIKTLEKKTADIEDVAVLVTIITDGMENASMEWTGQAIKKLIDERKEEGWMFSYIGADHDVEQVAATISITNTVVWTKTAEGTEAMIDNENMARERYFEKMACCEAAAPCMSVSEKKKLRKQFSEGYYKN